MSEQAPEQNELTIQEARRQYRERGDPNWYLHGLPPAVFEPFPCDLRLRLLHHDATLDAENKTDSSWFMNTEVDLSRVAACALVAGVEYSPTGDLLSLLTAQVNALLPKWSTFEDGFDVDDMKLRMPQLTPPPMLAKGSGVRPRVVNGVVVVPDERASNTLLQFTRTEPDRVLGRTKLTFDADLDDFYSVEIFYDDGGCPVMRWKLRDGPEAEWTEADEFEEAEARSVLDPYSWPQALVEEHFDQSKDPIVRAMIELIVANEYATTEGWADLLEASIGDSWKTGHAFDFARGRWKFDPTYATKRDDANRALSGRVQDLVASMNALLKPLPAQVNDHPNLGIMAGYLFEIKAGIIRFD